MIHRMPHKFPKQQNSIVENCLNIMHEFKENLPTIEYSKNSKIVSFESTLVTCLDNEKIGRATSGIRLTKLEFVSIK